MIEKMTYAPARIFGLKAGTVEEGATADITIIDTEREWQVDEKNFYTRGTHSPFAGRKLKGRAIMTLVDGRIVMQDGRIVDGIAEGML